jgi:thymidylate synthase
MIHKAFPGGIEDLREYVYELNGLKDDWVKCRSNKKDTKWEYTYHERLAHWGTWMDYVTWVNEGTLEKTRIVPLYGTEILSVNQIELVIEKLVKDPFTRQAQMITWVPYLDKNVYDPPCLQRIWFRIIEGISGEWYLNTNISFRSNDAYNAFMMNCFGLTMFIKENILDVLASRTGKKIFMGRINWQADSFHIYGKDIKDFDNRFMKGIMNTSFENRTMNFWSKNIQDYYREAEKEILEKIKNFKS